MRNPKRIKQLLRLIENIWKEYPDLRLMQLLENATGNENNYRLEDDDLIKLLTSCYYK